MEEQTAVFQQVGVAASMVLEIEKDRKKTRRECKLHQCAANHFNLTLQRTV
jgi:hypothetical protein